MKIKKIKRFLDSSAQISSKLKVTNIHIKEIDKERLKKLKYHIQNVLLST